MIPKGRAIRGEVFFQAPQAFLTSSAGNPEADGVRYAETEDLGISALSSVNGLGLDVSPPQATRGH